MGKLPALLKDYMLPLAGPNDRRDSSAQSEFYRIRRFSSDLDSNCLHVLQKAVPATEPTLESAVDAFDCLFQYAHAKNRDRGLILLSAPKDKIWLRPIAGEHFHFNPGVTIFSDDYNVVVKFDLPRVSADAIVDNNGPLRRLLPKEDSENWGKTLSEQRAARDLVKHFNEHCSLGSFVSDRVCIHVDATNLVLFLRGVRPRPQKPTGNATLVNEEDTKKNQSFEPWAHRQAQDCSDCIEEFETTVRLPRNNLVLSPGSWSWKMDNGILSVNFETKLKLEDGDYEHTGTLYRV